MSMTDPIADLLTRIRNGQRAGKPQVSAASSRAKVAVVKVLKDEGYIADFAVVRDGRKSSLNIQLKYHEGRPVIRQQGEIGGNRHGAAKLALP